MSYFSAEHSIILKNWEFFVLFFAAAFIFVKWKSLKNRKNSRDELAKKQFDKIESEEEDFIDDDDISPSLGDISYIPYPGATKSLQGGAREFYEIMQNRRSVRNFSTESVDIEILEKCIQIAGTAPSGAHTEPWSFCLVVIFFCLQLIGIISKTLNNLDWISCRKIQT